MTTKDITVFRQSEIIGQQFNEIEELKNASVKLMKQYKDEVKAKEAYRDGFIEMSVLYANERMERDKLEQQVNILTRLVEFKG